MNDNRGIGFAAEAVQAALRHYDIEIDGLKAETVARAAVAALREPSAKMLESGRRSLDRWGLKYAWKSMLAAALNDEPGG
jgi:hypothetical protein